MSTKSSRKSANPRQSKAPEPIITRTKSRQLKNKTKKTVKPEVTKPEIKSPKVTKTVIRAQESLLKVPVKESDDVVIEQVEYYPNTLKRDVRAKKIMLKPKHNFKVIATTNKRKLATPQKGIKSPLPKNSSTCNLSKSPRRSMISTRPCSSSELSMQDMVRMMEETRSLSDEDFMEILTCPSPVWWEDPPDGGFDEDSIHRRSPELPPARIAKEPKKRKLADGKKSNKSKNKKILTIELDDADPPKAIENKKDKRFVQKKQKLENILGIIKNKSTQLKHDLKNCENSNNTNRKLSESEGDISDLSFNEEEILKNLENMDIPIEQSHKELNDPLDVQHEIKEETIEIHINEVATKNDNKDIEILSIENELSIKSPVFDKPVFDKDTIPDSSSESKSDVSIEEIYSDGKSDDIITLDSCTDSTLDSDNSSSIADFESSSNSDMEKESPKEDSLNGTNVKNSNSVNNSDIVPNKKTKELSEFITVYKIMPEIITNDINPENEAKPDENTKTTKLDTVRGKLSEFFKQCKNNKRLKKADIPIPALPVTDDKEESTDKEKQNGDGKIDLDGEKNRLKNCDYCVAKTENGITDFSCEKCETAPILPCGLCNFLADTKEVYRKHVSSCKDVARISWSHNLVLNQT